MLIWLTRSVGPVCLYLRFTFCFFVSRSEGAEATAATEDNKDEAAQKLLNELEADYSANCYASTLINFNYLTNINKETEKANIASKNSFEKYAKKVQRRVMDEFPDWKHLKNPSVRRQIQQLLVSGAGNMTDKAIAEMNKIAADMESAYSKATVCEYKNPSKCGINLDPFITNKMASSEDQEELAYYWNAWHDAASKSIPAKTYKRYVDYLTAYAHANDFSSYTDMFMWTYNEETPGWTPQRFLKDMSNIWEEIRPKYDILYAYVRMKLRSNSPFKDQIEKCGKIPIHLTGNMWGQSWRKFDQYTKPYPEALSLDVTPLMIQQNYTVLKMYQVSDEFFQSLGLLEMTDTFWNKSMLEKPKGRNVSCHPFAHDMCKGYKSEDFRINMCTQVNMKDLVTVHHEMGHIQYYHQYTNQPYNFRNGANPGFDEAIGDTLALAVTTPQHLQCFLKFPLGLDLNCNEDNEPRKKPPTITDSDMNHLFFNALDKLAVLGFSMALDEWRFEVFDGEIQPEAYNRRWWEIRQKYQGLSLPNPRDDDKFDPAAKFHVPTNTEYVRYFFSTIVQFSFYEAMCKASGQFDPSNLNSKYLYECDFSGSKKAGKLLADMLKMGFRDPWPITLKAMTGSDRLSASSFLNYFKPLFQKLEMELKANGEWDCLATKD